jgi:hypothetical protein
MEPIPINIWDDYHEDGYIPEGKIQETYMYVEDTDISHEARHNILKAFMRYISSKFDLTGVILSLDYYDSKLKYPNLVGTENEWCLFERWQINVKHLTHEKREEIVKCLKDVNLKILDIPIVVYSES